MQSDNTTAIYLYLSLRLCNVTEILFYLIFEMFIGFEIS